MSGIVFIISAPSGSGKSTLTNRLLSIVPDLEFSVSYTTRPPRGSETSGREYFYISRGEFENMVRDGAFLEHADVFGHCYGTAKSYMQQAFARGKDLLLDIDVQGAGCSQYFHSAAFPRGIGTAIAQPQRSRRRNSAQTAGRQGAPLQHRGHYSAPPANRIARN
jgi:guanylate kinase